MNSIFKKLVTGTAVLALSTTLFASVSLAEDTSTVISGGSLGYTGITATNFVPITLNGGTQTVTAQINPFVITDARGTGAGWNVSVSATPFSQALGEHPLSAGAFSLSVPPITAVSDSDTTDTITKTAGLIDLAAVKILSATLDGGMGSYNVDAIPMTLTLKPHEVYEGTYTSTVTATLTATP